MGIPDKMVKNKAKRTNGNTKQQRQEITICVGAV